MSYRIRIIIEMDVENIASRSEVNRIAQAAMGETITSITNPVYLSTERIEKTSEILRNDK